MNMRIPALASAIALFCLLSCSKGGKAELSPLMRTVPSRSVAVMHFDRCNDALDLLLDSTSLFRQLDYGRLGNSEIILSYDYSAGLIPLLSIDAGRASNDTSSSVRKLLEQVGDNGLRACYTADMLQKRAAVLISPSQQLLEEALGHIESGNSILDAQGFAEAAAMRDGGCGCILLKNGSASRLLPKKMLSKHFARKDLVRFFSGAAEWTLLEFASCSREDIKVKFRGGGKRKYLCELFAHMPAAESGIAAVAPQDASFVLGLPLKNAKEYLAAWQECLDQRADISKYRGRLAGLKKAAGKSPEAWLAEIAPREIALVKWDSHELLLIRPSRKARNAGIGENTRAGFIPALFGEAFRIADDSCTAAAFGWMAFGSEEDLDSWLQEEKGAAGLPRKAKYYLINDELSIVADAKNIVLNVN
ncbi:MAG: hypothetical protein IKX45_02750 [Bacteroidales bacterium]|nr:hypothetical protein [Bacteroidales bacterium]